MFGLSVKFQLSASARLSLVSQLCKKDFEGKKGRWYFNQELLGAISVETDQLCAHQRWY
jgi:hypothetical protein